MLNKDNKLKLVLKRMKDSNYIPDQNGLNHIKKTLIELKDDEQFFTELELLTKELKQETF